MTLGDLASWSALAAIAALVVSAVALALFFGGAGDAWGPVNDTFVALTLLLLVLPLVAVWRLAPDDIGPWFGILTLLAVAGALVAAAGQVLLVVGAIGLNTSFVTGGLGILPVVAWAVGFAYLVFTRDVVGVEVGWLLVGALGAAALLTVSSLVLPVPVTAAVSVVLVALLAGWLLALSGAVRSAI
jgi:hypothetical protein